MQKSLLNRVDIFFSYCEFILNIWSVSTNKFLIKISEFVHKIVISYFFICSIFSYLAFYLTFNYIKSLSKN